MASLLVCDKYGMSCGNVSKFMHIRAHKMNSVDKYNVNAVKCMDVCMDCYEKIFNIKEG